MVDKNISEAVELLYKGAKMLAQHCVDCKMPLFEYEGKVICPSCKREFKIDKNGNAIPIERKEVEKKDATKCEGKDVEKKVEDIKNEIKNIKIEDDKSKYAQAEEILRSKLLYVISRIGECKSIECLHNLVDLALKIVELIERIEKI